MCGVCVRVRVYECVCVGGCRWLDVCVYRLYIPSVEMADQTINFAINNLVAYGHRLKDWRLIYTIHSKPVIGISTKE